MTDESGINNYVVGKVYRHPNPNWSHVYKFKALTEVGEYGEFLVEWIPTNTFNPSTSRPWQDREVLMIKHYRYVEDVPYTNSLKFETELKELLNEDSA